MSKYTEEMLTEMREAGSFTYDSAKAFAEKHDISLRSVIAKVRALELDYQPKDPKVRSVKPKRDRSKADIVASIVRHIGDELPSLSKMTIVDLEVLEKVVA